MLKELHKLSLALSVIRVLDDSIPAQTLCERTRYEVWVGWLVGIAECGGIERVALAQEAWSWVGFFGS